MSLSDTDIQGCLSVSRNAAVGTNASVGGHLSVGHNLFVKGWLDAPNIKGPLKGLFASEEALVRAYPRPAPGWYALVGDALPADVWRAEGGRWVPTGEQGGEPSLWLDDLQQRMDSAEVAIDREAEERKVSDAALSGRIGEEEAARAEADAALGRALAFEVEAREAADRELAESIASENKARAEAVAQLAHAVEAEEEARRKADAAILGSVEISGLDAVTVPQGMAAVIGAGPHRYNVTDDGKVVGTLEVFGDEMGHVFTQVLTTHRLVQQGRLTAAHRDDRVYIYHRSLGLRASDVATGEWTPWRKISGSGAAEMAVEVDHVTGEVILLYNDDEEAPFSDAYINERGEIVFEIELTNN